LEKRPNDFDGFTTLIRDPADIERLDPSAAILLEPGQIQFMRQYPKSLERLVKQAAPLTEVPNLAKWLASLWNKPFVLEVHTSSELYDMSAVWLRFNVQAAEEEADLPAWKPAINLLSYRNPGHIRVPELLRKVFEITGEINHNGYGIAGRLHHPDRVGEEVTFFETLYNDKAFYRLPDLSVFWEFHGGYYESEAERRQFGLYLFDEGLPYFLNQVFGALLAKHEYRITHEGEAVD